MADGLEAVRPVYEPLLDNSKDIRLLRILPTSDGNDKLRIELVVVSLDDDNLKEYRALSYVWGDTSMIVDIIVNGHTITIGSSLATALIWLSKQDDFTWLWADALCINQTNVKERNQQVMMMGEIYSKASRVVAWLGQMDEASELASTALQQWVAFQLRSPQPAIPFEPRLDIPPRPSMLKRSRERMRVLSSPRGWRWRREDLAHSIRSCARRLRVTMQRSFSALHRILTSFSEASPGLMDLHKERPESQTAEVTYSPIASSGELRHINFAADDATDLVPLAWDVKANEALLAFGANPYWTRSWIVQELRLAQSVQVRWAACQIELADLWQAAQGWNDAFSSYSMRHIDRPNISSAIGSLPMRKMLNRVFRAKPVTYRGASTLDIADVADVAELGAKDPRDKIFGILGFLNPETCLYSLVRPDYSRSVEEVYTNFALYSILTGGTLDALRIAGMHEFTTSSMPSWVPDWRTGRVGFNWSLQGHETEVCQETEHYVHFDETDGSLRIEGVEVDEIQKVYEGGLHPEWAPSEFDDQMIPGPSQAVTDSSNQREKVKGKQILAMYCRLMNIPEGSDLYRMPHDLVQKMGRFINFFILDTNPHLPADETYGAASTGMLEELGRVIQGREAVGWELYELSNLIKETNLDGKGFERYRHDRSETSSKRDSAFLPFMTKSGKIGMGPRRIKGGDKLFLLAPHKLPFALRPEGGHYLNVGECSVIDLASLGDLGTAELREVVIR